MPRRLEARDAVEVSVTDSGMIRLEQEDPMGNDNGIVELDPNDIPIVVKWLQDLAVDALEIREMKYRETLNEQVVTR